MYTMNTEQSPPTVPDSETDLFAYEEEQRSEVYRVLSPLAVVSLALGALSVLTLLSWYLAIIPIAGITVALIARRQIQRAPDDLTGMGAATSGLVLSVAMWITGAVILASLHMTGVPIGYTEISFPMLQPDRDEGEILPAKATDLNEKRVYLTGYMYPGRQSVRIKEFVLVPSRGHCKFCNALVAPTEMIRVKLVGDLMADFSNERVAIGGKLLVDKSPGWRDNGGLPYAVEADYLRQ